MEKVCIIIPAHNEERRIEKTLQTYSSYFKKLKSIDYEILVVINATNDNTEKIVNKIKKTDKKIKSINLKKGGKGYAVKEGFKEAIKTDSTIIGFVDADMATPPSAYYTLIQNVNGYDGAIAGRYTKGSKVNPKPIFRRVFVSRVYNFWIRSLFFFPYKDTQCGAKVFKKEAIEKVLPHLNMSKWAFDIDILYNMKKLGFKVIESPTVWSDKEYSKINFMKSGPWMALAVLRLRMINSPFRRVLRPFKPLTNWLWRLSSER